ncbi:MAG: alpha-(1-_3)-arabinofuranosyltransferase family protein [Acidimicrobiales bacterium]
MAAHVLLAAICYVPLLLTARGRVAADTRQAVYLDPGRFLVDALSMWDPSRDLGTVTHQNIVLVWPMGAFYWLADVLSVPLWLAQRVWAGSILFAAGAGVLFLARTLRWGSERDHQGPRQPARQATAVGPLVAAVAYAMSPYVLQYGTRTSVLLLPWAALPWLIGLTARALETRGWRHPALVALVTLGIAVNATALALALLGPLLWIAWAVWGTREVPFRSAAATTGRLALIGVVTSLWWVVALLIEGRYGLPLLSYTETIEQVASTSSATEVLRGLGYWVPYLQQHDYPEVTGAGVYLRNAAVIALQLGLVVLTFAGLAVTRWRHRTFFASLVVIGVVIGIGAFPTTDPSPLSSAFSEFARSDGIGLALRSTTRAAPLAILGMACLLGAFIDALVQRLPGLGLTVAVTVGVLLVALAPSIASRQLVDPLYERPNELPDYWTDALAAADAGAGTGRLLEVPGTRYAAYRWGNTYEPITAGNAETPTAWREQIPYGGAGSADLLVALDNQIQEGRLHPDALAPVARLMGVSQILVRNDLAYERYDTIAPDRVWALLEESPVGLGPPEGFGPVGVNEPDPAHTRDDQPRPDDPTATYPALGLVPVEDAPGLVQQVPVASTVVLDGSGSGLVDAAGAGLIDGLAPVLYAATAAEDGELLDAVLTDGARIVLTDTNRRQIRRWRSIKNSTGITLRPEDDPTDANGSHGGEAPLDVFASTDSDWQTVAMPRGAQVTATQYGNPLFFEAGFRPAAALDGDPVTYWRVDRKLGGVGDRLTIELDEPLTTSELTITAVAEHTLITAVDVRFDDGPPTRVALGASSLSAIGQPVSFPERTFTTVSVEVAGTTTPPGATETGVGIGEVGLRRPDGSPILVDPVVRLPTALTSQLGERSHAAPLSVVLTRLRGDTADPFAFGEEREIRRQLTLPTARSFTLSGQARARRDPRTKALLEPYVDTSATCRTDLVLVDDVPVPVRVRGTAEDAADGQALTVEACSALPLADGTHEVTTTAAGALDIDQLALSSEAGGAPTPLDGSGRPVLPRPPSRTGPPWDERSNSEVSVALDATDGPSWLVLAQSLNDGWEASSATGPDVGVPILVNGFANGFYVPAPLESGTPYTLRWVPQRAMDLALVATLLGVIAALVLALRGRAWSPATPSGGTDRPDRPVLDTPWAPRPPVPAVALAGISVGIGVLAALVVDPPWGVAAAVIVAIAGRWRRGHALLAVGTVVAVAVAMATVVVERVDRREQPSFDFFTSLDLPHRIAMFGLVLLAGDLVLGLARPPATASDPVLSLRRVWRRCVLADDPAVDLGTSPPSSSRRRFLAACTAGAVPAVALFVWVVTAGTGQLFDWHPTADFYDAQAHSLLDGRLDIPGSVLGIEGFVSDGRSYMYQGPFPALIRLPVAAVTGSLDGRLAGLSMLIAFLVASVAISSLLWQVRRLVRGADEVSRGEAIGIAGFVFSATGGSVLLFEASQVSAYHESAIWGMALALATLSMLLRHLTDTGGWTLAATSVLATATMWSRASLGIGVVSALGLLLAGQLAAWWRARRSRPAWPATEILRPAGPASARRALTALLACAVPVLLYTGVNFAKFDSLVSVPWSDQVFTEVSSARREFLAANDQTFFGPQFAPTTAVAYLRPDAFTIEDRFPWIGFRTGSIGQRSGYRGVLFDKVDATGSIPVAFPLLGALGAVGLAAVLARARRTDPSLLLTGPLLGAAVATATIFGFGFIAHRYLGDVLPFMVLAASAGFAVAGRGLQRSGPGPRRLVVAGLILLGLFGAWTTIGQGLWYQGVYASPNDEEVTESFFTSRLAHGRLPVGRTVSVARGPHLPPRGAPGDLFVVGDCAGLYVSDGAAVDDFLHTNWKPVARTPAVGAHEVEVTFPEDRSGADPLLVSGTAADPHVLSVEYVDDDTIRFRYRGAGIDDAGPAVAAAPGRSHRIRLAADAETDVISVSMGGRTVSSNLYVSEAVPRLGVNDLDDSTRPRFGGEIESIPPSLDLCRDVLRSAADGSSG